MTIPLQLTIPSHSKYLSLTRNVLLQFLSANQVPDKLARKIVLCVDEACANIIKYSYDRNPEGPIEMSFSLENSDFVAKIRDYGKQCDVEKIKPRNLENIRPGGLGTHFIFEIMDKVEYCTKRETGTLLTMSKKIEDHEISQVSNKG
ncbi:MAG: ATP-binding protein [Nitrospinales bacterium]